MFLPHCSPIQAANSSPSKWMIVLHGIYGRGGNWRSFARKLCQERPDWGLLLTDLRMHGESIGAPPPHDLNACARDVLSLIDQQSNEGRRVASVLGHSFGGKVALEMRGLRDSLSPLWLIDSSPSRRPDKMADAKDIVVSVLRLLESLPEKFASRDAFIARVVGAGFDKNLALWLAMNLQTTDGGFGLRLDLSAMRALLTDYFARDLWSVVEAVGQPIHLVRATRSSALSAQDLSRLTCGSSDSHVILHELEGGHWLHVDALELLVQLVATHLS